MREQLKEIAFKAKEISVAISGWDEKDLDHIAIDLDGDISVQFSHYCCGDTDYHTEYLSEEDFSAPLEETVAKYKKIKEEQFLKAQREKKEREEKENKAARQREYKNYLKLKEKFEAE